MNVNLKKKKKVRRFNSTAKLHKFFFLFFLFLYIMNNRQRIDAEQTLYRTQQRIKKPDVYRNNIKKAKRIRHELLAQEEDEMKDDFVMQIASDSVNAASYLIGLNDTSVPVCFIHQIYSILPNPTLIDKELVR